MMVRGMLLGFIDCQIWECEREYKITNKRPFELEIRASSSTRIYHAGLKTHKICHSNARFTSQFQKGYWRQLGRGARHLWIGFILKGSTATIWGTEGNCCWCRRCIQLSRDLVHRLQITFDMLLGRDVHTVRQYITSHNYWKLFVLPWFQMTERTRDKLKKKQIQKHDFIWELKLKLIFNTHVLYPDISE